MLSNSRVLKANGRFTNIKNIKIGDEVINMYGKPIKITGIRSRKSTQNDVLTSIKTKAWYNSLICFGTQRILTWNNMINDYEWKQANEFQDSELSLLPKKVFWTFDDKDKDDLSFDNGFLYGIYLKSGFIKDKQVCFICENNAHDIKSLICTIGEQIFQNKPHIKIHDFVSEISFKPTDIFLNIFKSFGYGDTKHLPFKYYCNNNEFAQGVYHGLSCSSGSLETTKNIWTHETLYWSAMTIGRPLCFGQLHLNNKPFITSNASLYAIHKKLDLGYVLEVDCPSNSVIIDNLIVRCN